MARILWFWRMIFGMMPKCFVFYHRASNRSLLCFEVHFVNSVCGTCTKETIWTYRYSFNHTFLAKISAQICSANFQGKFRTQIKDDHQRQCSRSRRAMCSVTFLSLWVICSKTSTKHVLAALVIGHKTMKNASYWPQIYCRLRIFIQCSSLQNVHRMFVECSIFAFARPHSSGCSEFSGFLALVLRWWGSNRLHSRLNWSVTLVYLSVWW